MPFNRFRQPDGRYVDTVLGPEMKSTGEVMGFDADFGRAFAKAQAAAFGVAADLGPGVRLDGQPRQADDDLPDQGARPTSASRSWPPRAPPRCCAATASHATVVRKHFDGPGPERRADHRAADPDGEVDLVVNTPHGSSGSGGSVRIDGYEIRTAAVRRQRPLHHHRPGARRGRAGHRGADPRRHRRALAAGLGGSSGR